MKRSGNGVSNPQWVYIGIHFIFFIIPNPLIFKCGIGGSWIKRLGQVSGSLPGAVFPVFLVWIPFAYQAEQFLHRKMRALNVPYFGSGKTEWFFLPAILFAVPFLSACFVAAWGIVAYVLLVFFGLEKEGVEALKWVSLHPKGTIVIIVALKLGIIFFQIINNK